MVVVAFGGGSAYFSAYLSGLSTPHCEHTSLTMEVSGEFTATSRRSGCLWGSIGSD